MSGTPVPWLWTSHISLSTGLFLQSPTWYVPFLPQILFECPLLSKVLSGDHLIYDNTPSSNPSSRVSFSLHRTHQIRLPIHLLILWVFAPNCNENITKAGVFICLGHWILFLELPYQTTTNFVAKPQKYILSHSGGFRITEYWQSHTSPKGSRRDSIPCLFQHLVAPDLFWLGATLFWSLPLSSYGLLLLLLVLLLCVSLIGTHDTHTQSRTLSSRDP